MARKEFEGRSAAEAAIKACEELGFTRSELRYDVVSDTGEGIERRVVIAVESEGKPAPKPTPLEGPSGEGREERRPRERSERSSGDREQRAGGRGGDRDRGGRGGRGGDRDRGGRGGRGGDRDRGGRGGDRGRPRREREPQEADDGIETLLNLEQFPATAAPRQELTGTVSAKASTAKEKLNETLRLMKYDARAVIVQDDAQEIHLDVSGNDAKKVIGKKGEPLLSLQFLVNRMVTRGDSDGDQVVVLDVAGYRERRRAALADLARRLAARAVEEKKVVKLSPMSAHDRRVFHLTLTEMKGVTTQSEGEGLFRRLLIIPAEFAQDEAR